MSERKRLNTMYKASNDLLYPGVAQIGSALEWGSRGRRFNSCHSDHNSTYLLIQMKIPVILGFLCFSDCFYCYIFKKCHCILATFSLGVCRCVHFFEKIFAFVCILSHG